MPLGLFRSQQKLLATLEKRKTTRRLKITALNQNLKLFEKVTYIKAFLSKVRSLQVKPKEFVTEPANTRTAGIDTNLSISVRGGGAGGQGGGRPHGLEKFQGKLCFQGKR